MSEQQVTRRAGRPRKTFQAQIATVAAGDGDLPNLSALGVDVPEDASSLLDDFLVRTSDRQTEVLPRAIAAPEPAAEPAPATPAGPATGFTLEDVQRIEGELRDPKKKAFLPDIQPLAPSDAGAEPAPAPPTPTTTPAAPVAPAPPPSGEYQGDHDNGQQASPDVDPERAQRRRAIVGKYSAKFVSQMIASGSVLAHQALVLPTEVVEEYNALIARAGTLNAQEGERLQKLSAQMGRYEEMRSEYAAKAEMDPEDQAELQACIADIMQTEEMNMSPWWLIVIIVLFQVVSNGVGIFMDRMNFKKVK